MPPPPWRMTQADREEQAAPKKQKGNGDTMDLLLMMTSGNVTNQMLNIAQAQIGGETLNAAQKMNENSAKAAKKEIEQKARKQFREEKGRYSLEEAMAREAAREKWKEKEAKKQSKKK